MPSGLTYKIYDGTDMTLRGFALNCVRQLGAGYHASDQGSKELPLYEAPVLKVSDYHQKSQKEAESKLQHWLEIRDKPEEAQREYEAKYAENKQLNTDYEKTRKERRERYLTMLDKVVLWDLPEEYKSLKDLMINQIKESMDFDCHPSRIYTEERIPIDKWIQTHIDMYQDEIRYHKEQYAKEKKAVEENNAYLKGLYEEIEKVEPRKDAQ